MAHMSPRGLPRRVFSVLGVWILIIGIGLLPGCAGKEKKPAPMLSLEIEATADVNLGPGGNPLPVVVRVYALKGQGTFMTADFYSLFDNESAVLGPDLIAREELTLRPGERREITRPLAPEAAYIGAVAAYRDIDRSRWRAATALTPDTNNAIRIVVAAEAISAYPR
ncbi:type VI secretion system lipoprotein TssJ [Thiocapsa sp. UBA6158]|jgi:type VI secretion system protein VasD|uniref:type VI secretion system lipoprotein TssJ n=1 Tax=Thiocapsa sp. UBA6158 TaxID=1947692 RepID=UPI0025F89DE8|nr:type VI secretion system lipoprotein TssJ [Thiocapsa sp. UBA6158]